MWGPSSLDPALNAGSYVSIGSPWRAVRSALHPLTGEGIAEDVVKTAAVLAGIALFVLLVRAFLRPPAPGPDGASGLPVVPLLPERSAEQGGTGPAALAGVGGLGWAMVLAVAVAWLFAWPYVRPLVRRPGLGAARRGAVVTAGLAAAGPDDRAGGRLPAGPRVAPPAGLGWLETVVRTALTPAALLVILVLLVVPLWREWRPRPGLGAGRRSPCSGPDRSARLTS